MNNFTRFWLYIIVVFSFLKGPALIAQVNLEKDKVQNLVKKNAAEIGLSDADVENTIISSSYHDQLTNVDMVYIQQAYKGIPVYNAIQTVALKDGKVASVKGARITKLETKVNSKSGFPLIQTAAAVVAAAKNLNLVPSADLFILKPIISQFKAEFGKLGISKSNVVVQLLWLPQDSGRVNLTWQVEIDQINSPDLWLIHVDAGSGNVLGKVNLTVNDNWGKQHNSYENETSPDVAKPENSFRATTRAEAVAASTSASYRVIPFPAESMKHPFGNPTLVTDPWNMAGAANPVAALGWQNDGTTTYNITRGNNVWAKEDRANDNEATTGASATSTTAVPNLTFNFPFDTTTAPSGSPNQSFAITNLFYWNNVVHDISYQYGFDEVSGNFQNNNQGRGGLEGDYVLADAQDGGGFANANFSTPVDGKRPRMQMYLFNPSPRKTLFVNSPSGLTGFKYAPEGNISNSNLLVNVGPVTGNVVLYGNPSTFAIEGCDTVPNGTFTGKVVLIYRGNCNFTVKVKNAQKAGAIGVIIVNNIDGYPFTMTGTDNTITIPAVMVSNTDGNAIRDSVLAGVTVNVTFKKTINLDGDLDNGIMVHEYGHGISTRLTGGPANSSCLENVEQMGEGWSDYYSLMLTTDWLHAKLTDGPNRRPMGSYAYDQDPVTGNGIRVFPYSTDMTINPWTYAMIATSTGGETHNIGELWAATLWDMTWNIITRDGVINTNLYNASASGGNSVSLKLVTTALKLQSCSPGFLDGRDAILKADSILYNGKYSCTIWNAFARRGMGVDARQGSSNSYTDQVAGYQVPAGAIVKKFVDKPLASENEEITYRLQAVCQCSPITNYKIVDTLPENVSYVSGGMYDPSTRTVTFNIPNLASTDSVSFELKVSINKGSYTDTTIVLNEPVSSGSIPGTFTATTTSATLTNNWSIDTTSYHSAPVAFKAREPNTVSQQLLTSDTSFTLTGLSTLSFWHMYNSEAGFDGGRVEISTDSGLSWIDVGPYMYQNPYNSYVTDSTGTKRGFSGSSNGQFIQTKANLSSFKNKSIKIRFRFTTDDGTNGQGWYVDDILLQNEAGVYNVARIFNSSDQLQGVADTATSIRNPEEAIAWTGAINTDWHTPGNWQGNTVPTKFTHARIVAVTNQPVLSADASCLDLIMETGTTVTINKNALLHVYGNVIK